MKNKIKRISKGDFEAVQPDIRFSQTRIVMRISEGGIYEGSFTIKNECEGDVRGLVYPSSFRMQCKEQGFEGNPVEIHYVFDGKGMLPGDVEEGKFSIVCNGGEYEIAYTAVVEKPFVITEYGKIQNMKDFKKLAMTDFGEAQKLFRSKIFGEILKYEDERVTALYSNMRKWALDEQALEEFLVGTKQKEKIMLSFQDEEKEFQHLFETTKEAVIISKNTWGYLPISIHTEGDFIEVLRKNFSTEDFVGTNYYLEYIVHAKKLHAGNNFGIIYVETPYETIQYPIVVHQDSKHTEHHGEESLMFGGLLKSYMSCICGRLNIEAWTAQAIALVKELRELNPKNEMYELLLAHVFIRGGKLEEGKWILDNHNYSRFVIGKKVDVHAYYMFLTALVRKDETYTKRVCDDLHKLYAKNPKIWPIMCMLTNLDSKYKNYGEKLAFIKEQAEKGENYHILPLVEAYICYQEKSILLKKLGSFELKILDFATKYKMITEELALYTANLASQEKVYNDTLFQILVRSYKLYEDPMILSAICTLLIKGNKTGKEYFPWYEKAIDSGMRIAQLYEHYLISADSVRISGPFPRSVLLYFSHGLSMDYKKTALLYANIITYEDEESSLFASYRHKMESFAWEQLLKRHINENLRIIYKRFCSEPDNDVDHMKAIYDISNAYHVKVKAPNIQYVLVIEKNGTISQRIAYAEEGAQVIIYHKTDRLVWEADDGRHYTDSLSYEIKRLFYESQFVEMYKEKEALLENNEKEKKIELNFETLLKYGIDYFGDEQVFRFLSKNIREEGEKEDDYKLYLAFELLNRGRYDKVTLSYLASFYCGATRDMKKVWKAAKEYDLKTYGIAERIVTQMLFSETLFKEEDIFMDYYHNHPYFRLKLGYLAFVSQEYVVRNRSIKEEIIKVILKEAKEEENLADICKVAVLKFYAEHPYQSETGEYLRAFLQELCEKQLVFPFYLKYKEEWLREVMLYDKMMICYQTKAAGKVKLTYKVTHNNTAKQFVEQLTPMYSNIFVKQFVLYDSEEIKYSIKESNGTGIIHEELGLLRRKKATKPVGKFGRLNAMDQMNQEELEEAMEQYRVEEKLAGEMFTIN